MGAGAAKHKLSLTEADEPCPDCDEASTIPTSGVEGVSLREDRSWTILYETDIVVGTEQMRNLNGR